MKIKEVESITGITKQNIRYYEQQGLLKPMRNEENAYRTYSEEDIRTLKIIKLFRKLDMPIEEIRKLLSSEVALQEAVNRQKERLQSEQERLEDAWKFCKKIEEQEIGLLDVDKYLVELEDEERKGAKFADFISDHRKVIKAEAIREFRFQPDTMCLNPREFTEALCKYGTDNNLNLVITKEGMQPEFSIDGVEYRAFRFFGRFGAFVECQMKYPDDIIPKGMSKEKYTLHQILGIAVLPIVGIVLMILSYLTEMEAVPTWLIVLIVPVCILCLAFFGYYYYNNYKN